MTMFNRLDLLPCSIDQRIISSGRTCHVQPIEEKVGLIELQQNHQTASFSRLKEKLNRLNFSRIIKLPLSSKQILSLKQS